MKRILVVIINLVAIGIAIGVIDLLINRYGFHGLKEYVVAIALGVVAGLLAKAVFHFAVGYVWGRQDARTLKRHLANLYLQVNQDLIDLAPSDVKGRVADNAWYYVDGTEIGPVSFAELSQVLAKRQNSRDILVWCAKFPKWVRAGDVPQLDPVLPPARP